MVTTFASRLRSKSTGISHPEPEWVQFIKDHRRYIVENATDWYINPDIMGKYRYRLEEYLQYIKQDIPVWLVAYINQYRTNADFNNVEYIKIPSRSHLDTLRKSYNTFIANYKK